MNRFVFYVTGSLIAYAIASENQEIHASYEIQNDSIDVYLNVLNSSNKIVQLNYDRSSIISFRVACKENDGIGLFYTDAGLNCHAYLNDRSNFAKRIGLKDTTSFHNYCHDILLDKETIGPASKKKIFLKRLGRDISNCDSLDVEISIKENKYEFK